VDRHGSLIREGESHTGGSAEEVAQEVWARAIWRMGTDRAVELSGMVCRVRPVLDESAGNGTGEADWVEVPVDPWLDVIATANSR